MVFLFALVTKESNLSAGSGAGKEHDRRQWRMKGVRVGAAVEIVSDEQELTTISGTARGRR